MPLNKADRFMAVMLKTNGRCYYCGAKIWPGTNGGFASIDHFLPTSQGGADDLSNLVPACRPCNSCKCTRTPDEARHHFALKAAGMPSMTRDQITWARHAGASFAAYDRFQFWFETHKTRHMERRTESQIRRDINRKAKRNAVL